MNEITLKKQKEEIFIFKTLIKPLLDKEDNKEFVNLNEYFPLEILDLLKENAKKIGISLNLYIEYLTYKEFLKDKKEYNNIFDFNKNNEGKLIILTENKILKYV